MTDRNKERELLQLQCKLARLKINVERRKLRNMRRQEAHHPFDNLLDLAGNLPAGSLWKTALLPASWPKRILLGGMLMLFEYRQKKGRR